MSALKRVEAWALVHAGGEVTNVSDERDVAMRWNLPAGARLAYLATPPAFRDVLLSIARSAREQEEAA